MYGVKSPISVSAMMKKLQRDKDKEFKHIAHGLIPAASIAPKPAVPRTPPPRSPDPSPERPRSALAAAILSSSLTGQPWAIPLTRPRSFSETDRSESFISEPNFSTALYARDRWSDDLESHKHLSSSDHSENEQEAKEDEVDENEEDRDDHVYQTLDEQETKPSKPQIRASQPTQIPDRGMSAPDSTEETSGLSPEASHSMKKLRKSSDRQKKDLPPLPAVLITEVPSQAKNQKHSGQPSPEPSMTYTEVHREALQALSKKTRKSDEQKLLEERVQRLEHEISHNQASSAPRLSAGSHAELQNLRQHAQELVEENDALKLTVHRLYVELSQYQTRFRPLSKQESSKISGLPKTGTPPPWLLDMKYLSPLLLSYEDRVNEKDALLQTTEEEVKRLRVHVEEVVKENERLHDEIAKFGGISQKDCHQLQQQAFLVLQENQVLIDQLETQHVKAKASLSKHHSEVSKVSKQLMLLEAENQHLQQDLEESRAVAQKNTKQVHVLEARLKDAVTWDEHCNIAGKLRGQLEQLEINNRSEMDELHLRVSSLQEQNRNLAVDKANLTADVKRLEADLELSMQTNRRTERKMDELKQQKHKSMFLEEKTRHHLDAVIAVAEHIAKERDQLLDTASRFQQEKQGFISKLVNGTVRLGKLQEEVKVYRRQASTRLAALEEAAEGKSASYQREILQLQRLLRERQEAEERLLQSKREVEEELEVVWQAATRENQQIKETLLDSRITADLHGWHAPDKTPSPNQQRRSAFRSDSEQRGNSLDEKHEHSLDFYC